MKRVQDLPADLAARLGSADIIVFDGVCVLCSGFARLVLRADREGRFRFATAQSDVGQALYRALGLDPTEFETNLVIVDGRIWTHLDAFAAAMGALGLPWRALAALRRLPPRIKDPLYDTIAQNRYRIFGRLAQCPIPGPELRARFVPGGFAT